MKEFEVKSDQKYDTGVRYDVNGLKKCSMEERS